MSLLKENIEGDRAQLDNNMISHLQKTKIVFRFSVGRLEYIFVGVFLPAIKIYFSLVECDTNYEV